jgi:hypothetical protein
MVAGLANRLHTIPHVRRLPAAGCGQQRTRGLLCQRFLHVVRIRATVALRST